jgi:hypothetical protein
MDCDVLGISPLISILPLYFCTNHFRVVSFCVGKKKIPVFQYPPFSFFPVCYFGGHTLRVDSDLNNVCQKKKLQLAFIRIRAWLVPYIK